MKHAFPKSQTINVWFSTFAEEFVLKRELNWGNLVGRFRNQITVMLHTYTHLFKPLKWVQSMHEFCDMQNLMKLLPKWCHFNGSWSKDSKADDYLQYQDPWPHNMLPNSRVSGNENVLNSVIHKHALKYYVLCL